MRAMVLFKVASITLIWSSLRDPAWLGVAVAVVAITIHLASAETRARETFTIAVFALAGLVCESGLMAAGIVTIPGAGVLCPLWVVMLWAALGTLASGPLQPLKARPWLAGLVALLVSPLSFLGGEAAGAITLARPLGQTLVIVGLAVGVTFFAVFAAGGAARPGALRAPTPES